MVHNTKELYEKMLKTTDLCGTFELVNKTIIWNLFDGFIIEISIEPPATHFSIEKKVFWKISDQITHWHPNEEDIYDEVCEIGLKGNVVVIRKKLQFTSVVYMGKEENCPYSPKKKWSWGKIYYQKRNKITSFSSTPLKTKNPTLCKLLLRNCKVDAVVF